LVRDFLHADLGDKGSCTRGPLQMFQHICAQIISDNNSIIEICLIFHLVTAQNNFH